MSIKIIVPSYGLVGDPSWYGWITRSEDGGLSWVRVLTEAGGSFHHNCIARSPAEPICVSGNFKVRRSVNDGHAWETVLDITAEDMDDLARIACGGNTWCAAGKAGWFYRSVGGTAGTWTKVYEILYGGNVQVLTTDSANTWLAGVNSTYNGDTFESDVIYRSIDDGASWAYVGQLPNPSAMPDRAIMSGTTDGSGVWLFGTQDGWDFKTGSVYKSTNNGTSWSLVKTFPAGSHYTTRVSQIVTDSNGTWCCIYLSSVATDAGIYRSVDAGATWNQVFISDGTTHVPVALAAGGDGSWYSFCRRYAAGSVPLLLRSTNNGVTWSDYSTAAVDETSSTINDFLVFGYACPAGEINPGAEVVFV